MVRTDWRLNQTVLLVFVEGDIMAFGKKKAAPFTKGSTRKKASTKTAKGKVKKANPFAKKKK